MEHTRLPYTEMYVPTPHLRVTHATPIPGGRVSAVVKEKNHTLGVITIDAGQPRLEMAAKDIKKMERFADRCSNADGEPLPRSTVWQQLVMERLYDQHITRAQHEERPCVAVRAIHTTGLISLHVVEAPGPIGPGPEGHIDGRVFTDTVVRAEVWMACQWLPVRSLGAESHLVPETERITLPHTGIRIPARNRMWMQITDDGPGWSAMVWIDKVPLGRATEDGQGGLEFHCDTSSGHKAWYLYALMSQNPDGAPLTSGELLEALVGEHTTNRQLKRALRHHRYVVRLETASGGPGLIEIPDTTDAYPDYNRAREAALNMRLPEDTVNLELWAGAVGWVPVLPAPTDDAR